MEFAHHTLLGEVGEIPPDGLARRAEAFGEPIHAGFALMTQQRKNLRASVVRSQGTAPS
jgi:hypothetical protein